jgi:YVTN family beta-propeller protein
MALSRDAKTLYLVLNRNNTLAEIDIATRTVLSEIPVGNVPYEVIVKGRKAYVSNRGGRPAEAGDFTNDSSGTAIVADDYSALAITGTVSVVDLASRQEINTIEVGLHPSGMLLDGERLFVANTNSDSVSIIDLETEEVVKTVAVQPFVGAPLGSLPNGLALMDKETLVVSLGRNNALAIYELEEHFSSPVEFEGLVPTAWYPTDVIADRKGKRLIVANGKGVGSLGPEATVGPDPATNATGLWVHSNVGSTSIIAYPTEPVLHSYNQQAYHNNNWTEFTYPKSEDDDEDARAGMQGKDDDKGRHHKHRRQAKPLPIPKRLGDPSVFKHVFYIVKENRTYDQILADLPQGNGDEDMLQFGWEYTPNQHAMAEGFVLFDNLYDAGSLSADGHQWITQAYVVDYLEKSFGGWTRSYPYKGGDAITYAPSGFLWENALRNGKTVRVYGGMPFRSMWSMGNSAAGSISIRTT